MSQSAITISWNWNDLYIMLNCDTLTMLDEVSVKCYFTTLKHTVSCLCLKVAKNECWDTITDVGICSNKT